jgi:hypothetical protein
MSLRHVLRLQEADLERHLLEKAVDALRAEAPVCADCRRTPLVGERAYRLPGGGLACELCRPRHGAGLPCEVVAGGERGLTVKVRAA